MAVDGGFEEWRAAARGLLVEGVEPDEVLWVEPGNAQPLLEGLHPPQVPARSARRAPGSVQPRVSRRFVSLARMVSCHRSPDRWRLLYRALWRQAQGEPHLLSLVTDPDVHPLLIMARAVHRASHKMKAFVRFRAVGEGDDRAYMAWFEPPHPVVERTAPFFVRRFPAMRWSILTPDRCAHWDRRTLTLAPGAGRRDAPDQDDLEELWRAYYANIFNPARLNLPAMSSEMPRLYWHNLPEAAEIAGLTQRAPRRVARMLAQVLEPPEPIPPDCAATGALPPLRRIPEQPAACLLDEPGVDARHDPGLAAARRRAGPLAARPREADPRIRVGVAGWTDATLTTPGLFYPPGTLTAEDRLRHYATRFPIVEVDATYYALPTRGMAAAWAARTPPGFVFDVKAHGLMTGHGADVRRLPDWLRRALPSACVAGGRLYGRDLPRELLDEVWRRFLAALDPLRAAGKLGGILLQYPRWFVPSKPAAESLAAARERLGGDIGAVEFRHRDWMTGRVAPRTLSLLEELELAHVVVDGPQGMESSVPPVVATTHRRLAVFRLHGRRQSTWEARNDPATERYRYLYDEDELAEHLRRLVELSEQKSAALHVIFNNCHGNYAVTNATELRVLM
jgi:probable DNA metabolism protein